MTLGKIHKPCHDLSNEVYNQINKILTIIKQLNLNLTVNF